MDGHPEKGGDLPALLYPHNLLYRQGGYAPDCILCSLIALSTNQIPTFKYRITISILYNMDFNTQVAVAESFKDNLHMVMS